MPPFRRAVQLLTEQRDFDYQRLVRSFLHPPPPLLFRPVTIHPHDLSAVVIPSILRWYRSSSHTMTRKRNVHYLRLVIRSPRRWKGVSSYIPRFQQLCHVRDSSANTRHLGHKDSHCFTMPDARVSLIRRCQHLDVVFGRWARSNKECPKSFGSDMSNVRNHSGGDDTNAHGGEAGGWGVDV